jgi:molecular chaperone GrpE
MTKKHSATHGSDDTTQTDTPTASAETPTPEDDTTATRIAKLEIENRELVEHLQRLQAEFENYRKRVEREQEEQHATATDELLKELLPIIDTFELSLLHAKDQGGAVRGDDLYQGVLLIHDQLKHLLDIQGLTPIPTQGQFDPRLHEALMTVEQEGTPKGAILAVLQPGWQRNNRVIRPAKVSVAK